MSKTKEQLLLDYTQSGDFSNLEKLLQQSPKLDLNKKYAEGNTALIVAVQNDDKKIAKLLMDYGANTLIKNNLDQDVFDIMMERNDYDDMLSILYKFSDQEKLLFPSEYRSNSFSSLSSNEFTDKDRPFSSTSKDGSLELASYNQEILFTDIINRLDTMSSSELDELQSAIAVIRAREKTVEVDEKAVSTITEEPAVVLTEEQETLRKWIKTIPVLGAINQKIAMSQLKIPPLTQEQYDEIKNLFKKANPETGELSPQVSNGINKLIVGLSPPSLPLETEEPAVVLTEEQQAIIDRMKKMNLPQGAIDQKLVSWGITLSPTKAQQQSAALIASIVIEPLKQTIASFNIALTEQNISVIPALVKQLAASGNADAKTVLEDGLVELIENSPLIWQTELDNIKAAAQECRAIKVEIDNIEKLKDKVLKIYKEDQTSILEGLTEEQKIEYKGKALPIEIIKANKENKFSAEEIEMLNTLSAATSPAKYGTPLQRTEHNINKQFDNLSLSKTAISEEKAKNLEEVINKSKTKFQSFRSVIVAIKNKIGLTKKVEAALEANKRDQEVPRVKKEFTSLIDKDIDYEYKDDGKSVSIKASAKSNLVSQIDIAKIISPVFAAKTSATAITVNKKASKFSTAHIDVTSITDLAENNKDNAVLLACELAVPKIQELQQLDKILKENNLISTQLEAYIQEVAVHFAKAVDPKIVASLKPMIMQQVKDNSAEQLHLSGVEARARVIAELKSAGIAEDKIRLITTVEYNAQKQAKAAAETARSVGAKHIENSVTGALVTPGSLTGAVTNLKRLGQNIY